MKNLHMCTLALLLSGWALSAQAQDIDLSAFENMDLEQLQNMSPEDLNAAMGITVPKPTFKSGPSVPCAEGEAAEDTGCTPPDRFIFFRDFNAQLDERVRRGPYDVSTYQYARDCVMASATISYDPFLGEEDEEVLFDLRGIHNMEFWAEALHNLNHGRTEEDISDDLMSGDTKVAEIVMGDIDINPASENVYIQEYYKNCDETRSTLGGPRERTAPTGTIPASEYMGFK